jgi:3-oxoacyl-[acyl-carrier protein] reductase
MTTRLANRSAIVTGAADGIVEAVATLFAREGARVLAVDIQQERLDAVHRGNPRIVTMVQDLAAAGAAAQVVARAREVFGCIDILVNNAGIRGDRGRIDQTTDENWDRVMRVNVETVFKLSREATPLLSKSDSARIINIGSIHGFLAAPTLGPYVTSKHAVSGLTRAFALDLGRLGITVNCIMPGFVETGLTRDMRNEHPAIWDGVMNKIVLARPGQPMDIANMALFLASSESSFMTGACVPVDGGMSCWG